MRVVVASEATFEREQMRQAVLSLGLECLADDCVTVADFAARIRVGSPSLALVAVGVDQASALVAVHDAASTKIPIFAVCDGDDADVVPALVRAGVRGYLRKKELRGDLLNAAQELRNSGALDIDWGRVIAVTGGMPGVGVTSVATNLAFALAARYPGRVALAQLTNGVPDLALNLAVKPAYPLAELAAGWYRFDASLMKRSLVEHPAGVAVLADQPGRAGLVEWQSAAMRQVLVLLRSRFSFVVADLGHAIDPARQEALRFADEIAVVFRLDVPAVRITREFLNRLLDGGVKHEKLMGVVNRFGQREQLPWKQARQALNVEVGEWVPEDPARMNQSLNSGKPLVQIAGGAAITLSFAKLANRWSATKQVPARRLLGAG